MTVEFKAFGQSWSFDRDDDGRPWCGGEMHADWFFDADGCAMGYIVNEWGQQRTVCCLGRLEDENDDC